MNIIQRAAVVGNPNENLLNGLVGYWNFDEGAGNIVRDSSPVGTNYGVLSINSIWSKGIFGNCLKFNNSYYNITLAKLNTINFSVCGWVKNINTTGFSIFFSAYSSYFWLGYANNLFGYNIYPGINYVPTPLNKWFHFCVIYAQQTAVCYINGLYVNKLSTSNGFTSNNLVTFGAYNSAGQYFYNGFLDEFRIYNRALSSAEVAQLYAYQPNNGA